MTVKKEIDDTELWRRIKIACDKLEIPDGTYKVWKHRGKVSGRRAIPILTALKGTRDAIPMDMLPYE